MEALHLSGATFLVSVVYNLEFWLLWWYLLHGCLVLGPFYLLARSEAGYPLCLGKQDACSSREPPVTRRVMHWTVSTKRTSVGRIYVISRNVDAVSARGWCSGV